MRTTAGSTADLEGKFKKGYSYSQPWLPNQPILPPTCRSSVTRTMLPMVLTATMTHWTTCLRPLARLMALRGRRTRNTLRILTTEIAPELNI